MEPLNNALHSTEMSINEAEMNGVYLDLHCQLFEGPTSLFGSSDGSTPVKIIDMAIGSGDLC